MKFRSFVRALMLGSALLAVSIADARAAEGLKPVDPAMPRTGWDFSELAKLPVLAGGRMKPFDSYARDSILQVTGRRSYQGWDPTELMVSWLVFPREWEEKEFILVNRKDVRRQLGLDEERSRFSPKEIFGGSFIAQYANEIEQRRQGIQSQSVPIAKTSRQDPREEELKRLLDRIAIYRAVVTGEAWPVVPTPLPNPWATLQISTDGSAPNYGEGAAKDIRMAFMHLFGAYLAKDEGGFKASADEVSRNVSSHIEGYDESARRKIGVEHAYNLVHPFQWAWICYLIAALVWVATRVQPDGRKKKLIPMGFVFTGLGFLLHISGFCMRMYVAGRPPVTNMYESIVWVSFGILLFSFILWFIARNTVLFAVSCTLGTIGMIVADSAPAMIDSSIHPLVPVLRSNYWLTIHVLTITISYAAFALTMGLGNVSLWHYLKKRDARPEGMLKITASNLLAYRAMQFGVVLLAAGTILGGVWADYSWGRFWGWDPKEVWALIALMGYLTVLHARLSGLVKPFGFAAWTVIAYSLVLMAWYGVNFVLGVGLHSYGFSSGGQGFVAIFLLVQWAYVGYVTLVHKRTVRERLLDAV